MATNVDMYTRITAVLGLYSCKYDPIDCVGQKTALGVRDDS